MDDVGMILDKKIIVLWSSFRLNDRDPFILKVTGY